MLLGLAACITLAISAPTAHRVHVRQATSDVNKLNEGVRYSVSDCRPCFCSKLLAEPILPMVNAENIIFPPWNMPGNCMLLYSFVVLL